MRMFTKENYKKRIAYLTFIFLNRLRKLKHSESTVFACSTSVRSDMEYNEMGVIKRFYSLTTVFFVCFFVFLLKAAR